MKHTLSYRLSVRTTDEDHAAFLAIADHLRRRSPDSFIRKADTIRFALASTVTAIADGSALNPKRAVAVVRPGSPTGGLSTRLYTLDVESFDKVATFLRSAGRGAIEVTPTNAIRFALANAKAMLAANHELAEAA
jgi:hypothetical protein